MVLTLNCPGDLPPPGASPEGLVNKPGPPEAFLGAWRPACCMGPTLCFLCQMGNLERVTFASLSPAA